jgi:Ca2+-binding EF-hand superfamily protein
MLTDLQKQKLSHLFRVLDANRDDVLERADYDAIVSNLSTQYGWKPGSEPYSALEALYLGIWNNLKSRADANGDGKVSLREFLDFHDVMLASPELYQQITVGTVELLFRAFDRDHDGHVTGDDFRQFFDAYRISTPGVAATAFHKLDVTGHGRISREDALHRVKEYYFSSEPDAPGNWLFGPYQ